MFYQNLIFTQVIFYFIFFCLEGIFENFDLNSIFKTFFYQIEIF